MGAVKLAGLIKQTIYGKPGGIGASGMMPPITRHHKRNNPEYCEPAMTRYRLNLRIPAFLVAMALLFAGCASVNLESHVAESAGEALNVADTVADVVIVPAEASDRMPVR